MSNPFVAEVRMVSFNFPPRGWATCDGQILPISQNTALFSLLGTNYGGNGTSNFSLPNLGARAPMGNGSGPGLTPRVLGEIDGSQTVTLLQSEIPNHGHTLSSATLSTPNPAQNLATPDNTAYLGLSGPNSTYIDPGVPNTTFNSAAISTYGSSSGHENRQPYLGVYFIIAMQGVFPARN